MTNFRLSERRFRLDGKSKGFGFATFDNLEDAQKAIQTMNGQKVLGELLVCRVLPHSLSMHAFRPTCGSGLVVTEECLRQTAHERFVEFVAEPTIV